MQCTTNQAVHDVDGADLDDPMWYVPFPPAAPALAAAPVPAPVPVPAPAPAPGAPEPLALAAPVLTSPSFAVAAPLESLLSSVPGDPLGLSLAPPNALNQPDTLNQPGSSSREKRKRVDRAMSLDWHHMDGIQVYREENPYLSGRDVAIAWVNLSSEVRDTYSSTALARSIEFNNYIVLKNLPEPKKDGYQLFLEDFKNEFKNSEALAQDHEAAAKMYWNSLSLDQQQGYEARKLDIDLMIQRSFESDYDDY